MKTVYIVRHGETEGNKGLVFQGAETGLTEEGRKQAEVVAQRCARLPVDTVIASSMARSRESAEIIAEATGLPIETSELFDERRRPSRIAGKSVLDPDALLTEAAVALSLVGEGPKVEDGDDFHDLKPRAIRALEYLEKHTSDSILVVGHGTFTKFMLAVILMGPELTSVEWKKLYLSMRTDNTGISVITMDSKAEHTKWNIRVFNDRAHLAD